MSLSTCNYSHTCADAGIRSRGGPDDELDGTSCRRHLGHVLAVGEKLLAGVGLGHVRPHELALQQRDGFVVARDGDVEHRLHQSGLVGERLVHRLHRNASLGGHGTHRGCGVAVLEEEAAGSLQHRLTCLASLLIGTARSPRQGHHA